MAYLGADVIKVEPPGGDLTRRRGPFPNDQPDPERSGLFIYLNAGKLGITLDLTHAADRAQPCLGLRVDRRRVDERDRAHLPHLDGARREEPVSVLVAYLIRHVVTLLELANWNPLEVVEVSKKFGE